MRFVTHHYSQLHDYPSFSFFLKWFIIYCGKVWRVYAFFFHSFIHFPTYAHIPSHGTSEMKKKLWYFKKCMRWERVGALLTQFTEWLCLNKMNERKTLPKKTMSKFNGNSCKLHSIWMCVYVTLLHMLHYKHDNWTHVISTNYFESIQLVLYFFFTIIPSS